MFFLRSTMRVYVLQKQENKNNYILRSYTLKQC